MAITRFDGTTSGSNSGWTARYYHEGMLGDGTAFRIEVIDSQSAAGTFSQAEATVEWLDLVDPAFLLEYEGNADHRHEPLVPSTCTIELVQVSEAQGELMDAIHANVDHRFGIAIFLFEPDENADANGHSLFADGTGFWRPFWFGTIMADQGEAEHLVTKRKFSITAQCGLVLLNDEPFRQANDDEFTDEKTLAVHIARCLNKLPTATLWGFNQYNGATSATAAGLDETDVNRNAFTDIPATPFFRESVWIQDKQHHIPTVSSVDVPGGASVLEHTLCQSLAFTDIERGEDAMGGAVRTRTFTSCSEVLENIASIFGAQIFLANGSWFFTNPECHLASVSGDIYHRQHVWFTPNAMLTADSHGPLTTPIDTTNLDIFARGYNLGQKVRQNVLFPVKAVASKHIEGGVRRITQGDVFHNYGGMFGTRHDHAGTPFQAERTSDQYELRSRDFNNEGFTIAGGQSITMSGRLSLSRTGVRFVTTGYQFNTDKARGAKYKAEFKIKVGNYYLKRDITTRTETAPIKNSVGSTVRTAKFFEQSGDVEWTTNVETYDLVFPRDGSNPEVATVELSDSGGVVDFDFIGGLHTQRRSSNAGEFKSTEGAVFGIGSGTITQDTEFEFNWTLPPLPDGEDHTGVEINIDFKLLDSENDVITGVDSNSFFEHNDTQSVGTLLTFARIYNFDVVMGDGDEGGDVEFVAQVDHNTTKIVTCESVLGDFYDETAANRGMRVQDVANDATFANSTGRWVVSDNITADGKMIHKLRAAEVLSKRDKPMVTRSAEMVFTDFDERAKPLSNERNQITATAFPVLHFGRPVKIAFDNGVNEWFHLLEFKMSTNGYEFVMCKLGTARSLETITEADDSNDIVRGPRPPGTIVSDVPVSRNPISQGTLNQITRNVNSNITNVTAIATKTDFISVTGAVDLDTVNAKVGPLTLNAGGTAFTSVGIEQDAIRADKLLTSTDHQLITQTQLNAISSNTLTTASHTTSIADIEDKTDLISVTSPTNLDSVRDDTATNTTDIATNTTNIASTNTSLVSVAGVASTNATNISTNTTNVATNTSNIATNTSNISTLQSELDDVEAALDESNNGAANRTGQTGVEVATFNASGVLGSVGDGSAGQFLQTNGSGVLSFANAGGGWHGSATLIKVFPTEFFGNDVGRAITQVRIEDDTSNTLGAACNQATGLMFAFNEIPTGYKATHVQVYTDAAVSGGVEIYSFNHTTGAITSVGTGNTNASIDITDITSGATASIVIEVAPGSTDRLIFGADITIAST